MAFFGETHNHMTDITHYARCQTFAANSDGRDFVVGDIHGQYRKLREAMDAVAFNSERDRLFLVGDLVDRGPQSMECLCLPYQSWAFSVVGNHEQMMMDGIDGYFANPSNSRAFRDWLNNGGQWMLDEEIDELRMIINDMVRYLPLAMQIETTEGRQVGVVHAGVTSGQWGVFNRDADIWTRSVMSHSDLFAHEATIIQNIDAVVVGHCIREGVTIRGNQVGMDVGTAKGNAPVLWTVDEVVEAVDRHLLSGRVSTEYRQTPESLRDALSIDDDWGCESSSNQ